MAERQRRADGELSPAGLRILFVGHRFPPDGSGGYELHCAAVRRHLQSRGHQVRVLVSARGRAAPPEPGVHRALRWHPPGGPRLDRARAWAFEDHNRTVLDAEFDAFEPDVVCFWRLGELSLSMVERIRERGLPALGYVGDGWLHEGVERDPWTPYRARPPALGDAATWVFNSRWLREATRAAAVAVGAAPVIAPGVDRGIFTPREAREWRGSLLYAGRLTPAKGVDDALRALARLPGARLLMVGDATSSQRAALRSLAASLGVAERVAIQPAVEPAALAVHYRAADAVLFPARWQEPFGLVPLEAMASGVPVIATATGGSAEYLAAGVNALVVAPGDPAALAAAVVRLAGDRALRERLRGHGLATAARHDRDEASAALEALLRELAGVRDPEEEAEMAAGSRRSPSAEHPCLRRASSVAP
ncbi:MAG: hypothetical protein AVDCRST_MAG69-2935 [uncultured Solirubrobacteraceae bacterium]|uniref:Uncharacterized protein n=1 Tax=uncultured Solirubrobacteraceae bacterium TaxID=1162706 RepID=A0A6J4TBJ8_9ACTN|nr:MAG: hypothetical protein AVDCRST_MAG69-2935 [uncultured Solirubrobacteraceae bacterium]